MNSEPDILVAMRANDAPMVPQGATFDQKCSDCAATVVLAPSGQRFLAEHPGIKIQCLRCFKPVDGDENYSTAFSTEERRHEHASIRPNPYLRRN